MVLPVPPNPYITPVLNNPFFWPQSYSITGWQGPLVVGSGLTVSVTGVISASGGGGGGTPATPATEGIVYALTEPLSGATFNTGLGNGALATVTGTANVAVGLGAGGVLTTGSFNTYLGAGAGSTDNTGTNNIGIGFNTLNGFDGGSQNIVIGFTAGSGLTTEDGNVIIGAYAGNATVNDNIYLANGSGTLLLQINDNGAFSFGGGSNFGTIGQVLTSGGTASNPTWVTGASGSFTAGANTVTVTNGIITSIA
jgi:hypothetical protein